MVEEFGPGPVLVQEIGRTMSQDVQVEFYTFDEARLVDWLSRLEQAREGTVKSITRAGAPVLDATPDKVVEMMAAGEALSLSWHGFESLDPRPDVLSVHVTDPRPDGRRNGSMWLTRAGTSWRDRFEWCSVWFDQMVEALHPAYAFMYLGSDPSALFYDSAQCLTEIPVCSYGWRNFLTPRLVGELSLGDGTELDEPTFVDFGRQPFVPLARRDWVASMLSPLLPPRRANLIEFDDDAAQLLQLAAVDGGIELPDAYQDY